MIEFLPRIRVSRLGRTIAVCLICALSLPIETLASTDIVPGQTAVVSDTGGDPINLRAQPNTSSDIVATLSEGETVDVIEGPIQDDAGIWWYRVDADGTWAYITAEFLTVAESDGNLIGTVTSTATIANTGGDPVNCRAGAGSDYSVVTTFTEGDSVDLTGEADGAWQPVNCAEQSGYVHTDYIAYDGFTDEPEIGAESVRPGSIINTDGDPINLRAKPRITVAIVGTTYEGDAVQILTGPIVDSTGMSWYKVIAGGTRGYVAADYVSDSLDDDDDSNAGRGEIVETNGDGANCRSKASSSGAVLTVLAEGTMVDLRGSASNGWQPVVCANRNGFVSAQFVDISDGSDDGDDSNSSLVEGDEAVVANTGGQGVRLRSQASATSAVIVVLTEGSEVVVGRGSTRDWVAVTFRTSNGFIHMDYLEKIDASDPTPAPDDELRNGDHAKVTDLLNFRDAPSFNGAIVTTVAKGTVVLVTGTVDNGFYPVEIGGFDGYLHSDYLVKTSEDLTDDGNDGIGGDPGNDPATPQGTKMITYAMKYLGYPYVWATHGPSTFDCSGFTYWVTIKTLKMDIGAGTWSQSVTGTPIAYGDLRPGDLIFFQNTFTWGLSHVGIYIGNGEFIHAENETNGVVISKLTSTYYKTRWYGARRITTD